eukprot:jgi/Phyca11/21461/fgenesh1_pg.PHYCAscaffold_96_\
MPWCHGAGFGILVDTNSKYESYTDSTLHGVSSLFCRLGLRPYASSPIATRLVANFMSVLHYVGYKNDTQISGYVSDPILTFGAARMWYQFENSTDKWPSALESDILPQLETILLNGLIDTGNIGELVARIFLLLAMDAVAFVKILVGENPYRQMQNKANTLSKLKNHEVIRLYVSLREVLDEDHFAQSIEMNEIRMPRAQKKPKSMSDFGGALCVRGVLAPVQVKCDLKSRDDHEKKTKQRRLSSVLSADDAEKTASHTLKFASKVTAQ